MQYRFALSEKGALMLPSPSILVGEIQDLGIATHTLSVDKGGTVHLNADTMTDQQRSDLVALLSVYENSYTPSPGTLNDDGRVIYSPTFEDILGMDMKWKGVLHQAQPGVMNCFDQLVTTELRLRGGWYELLNPDQTLKEDYLEFSVIDKDDVLGLFAQYGLTVGEDFLELKKYVVKEHVNKNANGRNMFQARSAFRIMAGLYFRACYHSYGQTAIDFKTQFLVYE
jgi:hypothetical protein